MIEMEQIGVYHKKQDIAKKTKSHVNSITNWFKTGNMPIKFLSILGFRIIRIDAQLYTSEEVKDILDASKNNRTFGIKVDKKSAGGK